MTLFHQLSALEASGLVRLAVSQPELEYLFRHALIQDAAYRSLVKPDRKQLHRAVGETFERLYAERSSNGELAPLLGRHFFEAGDAGRALKYFMLAGDAAARIYANAEAITHYTTALEAVTRGAVTDSEHLIHLYTSLGQAYELSGQYPEALASYAAMERLAHGRSDQALELAALMARAKVHATLTPAQDPDKAQALLEQALALARELEDRATECKILWNLMLLFLWGGKDQHRAVDYGEQALMLARELDLREQLAFTLNDLAYGYMSLGRWAEVLPALDESRELWQALGNQPMLADNLANSVLMHLRGGRYEQAIGASEEALRISRSIDNVWGQAGSLTYVGLVYLERGEPDRAIAIMEQAIRLGEQAGHPAPIVATRADLSWVYGTLGAIERGLELARLALDKAETSHFLRVSPLAMLAWAHLLAGDWVSAEATIRAGYAELKLEGLQWFAPITLPLAEAELALIKQDYARAMQIADDVLSQLHNAQTRLFRADTLCVKGRALLGLARIEEARAMLVDASTEAEALGSRRTLWPILMAQADVEAQRGNLAEAQALRWKARAIVEYIADHAGAPELRASFLDLPQVRNVMRETY
ncbi:MAG TPA: tetratricopeptide repeat protein [Anaerolineae bacterium]|nr:tetratricopeptide repeat protein [Anaerolineae bacterium]